MKLAAAVLAVALGVLAIVGGGLDDAPGAQLLGVALITGTVFLSARSLRRSRGLS